MRCDAQLVLDLAHDYARAGFFAEGLALLDEINEPRATAGSVPIVHYTAAWLADSIGDGQAADRHRRRARSAAPDYCFPARREEIGILQSASIANPSDARAPYYLGNLFFDRGRHEDAIAAWEKSARLDPSYSVVWRNLGIGYFNVRKDAAKARRAYDRALRADATDARLVYERDQLWKLLGIAPAKRLRELQRRRASREPRRSLL